MPTLEGRDGRGPAADRVWRSWLAGRDICLPAHSGKLAHAAGGWLPLARVLAPAPTGCVVFGLREAADRGRRGLDRGRARIGGAEGPMWPLLRYGEEYLAGDTGCSERSGR